ncbi:hypothetical protein CPSG_02848 [Coccidioides posadasii str. Silveira]|uniref:Uncharacterized protein n=1 Tax=Coccidioides posadasii (strain RMSCC 757 / Silveira) TaxID=443226 RepID=E9CYH8_COCPS|nr:hypothetical protein CPSG_02848 [Coccidioides posadasii str. Silveira]
MTYWGSQLHILYQLDYCPVRGDCETCCSAHPRNLIHISSRGLCATETPKARHILDILNNETGLKAYVSGNIWHIQITSFDIKSRIHSREPLIQSHGPMIDNKQNATQCAIATANRNTRAK